MLGQLDGRGGEAGRASEAAGGDRLREALDFIPEGIAFFDAEDRIVLWNRRYAELNDEGGGWLVEGASFRDLLEAGLRTGVYPEAEGREAEWLQARLALRSAGECALEQENKGHWLRIVERRTADGGVVSICEDITELKQREATLRMMFENSPVPMWVVCQGGGRITDANAAAEAHYGYPREQLLEKTIFDIYAPEEHEDLIRHMRSHGPQAYHGERVWKQLKADGSEVWTKPFVQALRVEGGGLSAMAAQFDMTASKRAEAAMAAARDQAEAASRAKSEFLANMSHEIRTPLNGVLGLLGVLKNTPLSDVQAEMLDVIQSSAQSLETMLRDVLDFARVESGRLEVEREPFDLGQAVREAAAPFALQAAEKGLDLALQIAPSSNRTVIGDEHRLKQVLANLLGNAVKFTATGVVTLRVAHTAGAFVLEVEDTGVGFDAAVKEKLFTRFEQEDGSATRRFGGSGLGLAISRRLAELMGGTLDACSTPGRGSVFTLRLPLGVLSPEDASAPLGGGLRILLADDHPTNQKVVELLLSGVDVELTCVDDGEQAVAAALSQPFDVVLMDMQMPVMDGLTAIRRIREQERAAGRAPIPIYTLSANAMGEHERASLAAGADRHLTKPIDPTVLLTALAEVTAGLGRRAA